MKKILFTLLVAFGATASFNSAMAQLEVQSGTELQNGAIITFAKEVHDYGNVKNGGDGTCTFEFTNTGTAPLLITNAKGSCGCTVPEWPKEAIAPGAKGEIKVVYNTKNAGPINKSFTISSNAVNDPVKVVQIKGSVAAAVEGASPVISTGAPSGPVNN